MLHTSLAPQNANTKSVSKFFNQTKENSNRKINSPTHDEFSAFFKTWDRRRVRCEDVSRARIEIRQQSSAQIDVGHLTQFYDNRQVWKLNETVFKTGMQKIWKNNNSYVGKIQYF